MSDHDSTPHHADAGHIGATPDEHGHDDHGHAADTLGPVDWRMWGVGVAGVISALIVVAAFVVATGFVFFDLVA
jgi:hypothetical protein